jgi:signal transduction histidine kinase
VRAPETSPGEINVCERKRNVIVGSLDTSQDKLHQVAQEQGALRRVATLIARGVSPAEIFTAVAAELGRVLGADHTQITRFEPDHTATVVGYWSDRGAPQIMPPLNGHWPIENETVTATVLTTGRSARMTDYERATSAVGTWVRMQGIRYVVGCPVKVEGRIWGSAIIFSQTEPQPRIVEDRVLEFVELVGTAIANAQSRSDLLASRARVIAAADEGRRRIERDLHDGAQQQLISLALKLRTAEAAVAPWQAELKEQLASTAHGLTSVMEELQEISRGLLPAILTTSGLRPALRSLARRSTVPVELKLCARRRPPEQIEAAIYYTVSESLTNVAKHAHASAVQVDIAVKQETVRLSIRDDGIGGADLGCGSGLIGLKDRVEALRGKIQVLSPAGDGTTILVDIPIERG